ncbi:MAG TPA: prepilin-type N-terminal cleavage/methylation domain-containing protein [Candidatus Saccharimonadales bacterium]
MIKKLDQKGFTIVELLIATSVFASILLIVTYGIIQISKMYTNGFIQSQTQNVTVSLSDQVTRDIGFSSASSITPDISAQVTVPGQGITTYYYFCTNQNEYFYLPGGSIYEISLGNIGGQGCTPSVINNTKYSGYIQNLLSSNNMEILNHTSYYNQNMVSQLSPGLYSANIDVLYGSTGNLVQNSIGTQWICRPTVLIGPFCANYNLSTQVNTQD